MAPHRTITNKPHNKQSHTLSLPHVHTGTHTHTIKRKCRIFRWWNRFGIVDGLRFLPMHYTVHNLPDTLDVVLLVLFH